MLSDLYFAFNAVAPIIFTVAIGYFLKRAGLVNEELAWTANKMVFRLFLPVMLFVNVLGVEDINSIEFDYVIYAAVVTVIVFLIAIPPVMLATKPSERRGALLQATFRSNYAFVGIPLATALCGEYGAAVATLMSIVTIPLFNALAVVSLSIFSDSGRISVKKILLGIVKNPLIIGIFTGIVFLLARTYLGKIGVNIDIREVGAIWGTLKYLSSLATPLALVMLGAQFEFSAIASLKREIIFGTLAKCFVVPLIGIGVAYIAFRDRFDSAEFASLLAVFATPISISSVPMAQEMGADSTLAGQLVVFTTLGSALTIFLSSFILKTVGVF